MGEKLFRNEIIWKAGVGESNFSIQVENNKMGQVMFSLLLVDVALLQLSSQSVVSCSGCLRTLFSYSESQQAPV